jgi:hypothetical protein
LRKPQKLWFLLVALCCCLIPKVGPGQLSTVENRSPVTLGTPQEPEKTPQVLEFAPAEPPIPSTIVFDAKKPPVSPIVVFEPIDAARPKSKNVPGLALPIATTPMELMAPVNETEPASGFDPLLPPVGQPLERPTFGAVVTVDFEPPVVVSPRERPSATLVYWTNHPIQVYSVETPSLAATAVNFDAPIRLASWVPRDEPVLVQPIAIEPPVAEPAPPAPAKRYLFTVAELEAAKRAYLAANVRRYVDQLGSPDGTPRLMAPNPRGTVVRYEQPPQRRIDGVMHWAFSSGSRVCESMLWPLRILAEPFRDFD